MVHRFILPSLNNCTLQFSKQTKHLKFSSWYILNSFNETRWKWYGQVKLRTECFMHKAHMWLLVGPLCKFSARNVKIPTLWNLRRPRLMEMRAAYELVHLMDTHSTSGNSHSLLVFCTFKQFNNQADHIRSSSLSLDCIRFIHWFFIVHHTSWVFLCLWN